MSLRQAIDGMKGYPDSQEVNILAKDLRANGFQIASEIPDARPVALNLGDVRKQLAKAPVVDDFDDEDQVD